MIVGYLRVSTCRQHLTNQQEEIQRFAAGRHLSVDRWVTEIVSGKKNEKERKLGPLLRKMTAGDTIIVTEISRLSRTMTDIMSIMVKCLKKKINLYTTKEGYAFDESINSKVLCFAFGLVAEIERNLISLRTREALAARKANGVVLGRRKGSYTKTNILLRNRSVIVSMLDAGISINSICGQLNVSRETFYKFRRKAPEVDEAIKRRSRRGPASGIKKARGGNSSRALGCGGYLLSHPG